MSGPSDNLIQDFALHPDKWAAANKQHVANSFSTTVAELEARIAKYVAALPVFSTVTDMKQKDMPSEVLTGKLGAWCTKHLGDFPRALSWPAILTIGGLFVEPGALPSNLYTALVSKPEAGKSEVDSRARRIFGMVGDLDPAMATDTIFGSSEGMVDIIGDKGGRPYLWCPDELSGVMMKAQIQGSNFPSDLCTLWYRRKFGKTVKNRKAVNFHAWLSILAGITERRFSDCFGAETLDGLYSRFLFGLCPSDWSYDFKPARFEPEIKLPLAFDGKDGATPFKFMKQPVVHEDVFDAKTAVCNDEKIPKRLGEIVIRCAMVVAAWDEKVELRASDMEPFWHLLRYENSVRLILQPSASKSYDGQISEKVLSYLANHNKDGEYLSYKEVMKNGRIYNINGPVAAKRVVDTLVATGELEDDFLPQAKNGKKKRGIRLARPDV
jgi:hypothetical protein